MNSESKTCLVCGNIFYRGKIRRSHWLTQKYCSRKCSLKITSVLKQDQTSNKQRQKGSTPWNKGTKGICKANSGSFQKGCVSLAKGRSFPKGENAYAFKPKAIVHCEHCGKDILLPPWRLRSKRYFCDRICWSQGTRGKGSPVFKGDDAITPFKSQIMQLPEYKDWHATILKRDDYTCIQCGAKRDLEVHHIKRFLHIIKENNIKNTEQARACKDLWNISNGQTLCKECHRKTDTFGTTGLKKHKYLGV